MSKVNKVDLTLLKRLVAELESSLYTAESIQNDSNLERSSSNKVEFVVEMNKATGLAAGLMTEAALLMGDCQVLIQGSGAGVPAAKSDFLDKILGGLKGSGNTN